jgi:hypothetical protein
MTRTEGLARAIGGLLASADLPAEQDTGPTIKAAAKQLSLSARVARGSDPRQYTIPADPMLGLLFSATTPSLSAATISKVPVNPRRCSSTDSTGVGTSNLNSIGMLMELSTYSMARR